MSINKKEPVKIGDTVRVGGFQPMSSMSCCECLTGVVTNIEENNTFGDAFTLLLDNGWNIKIRRQYCTKEK